MNIVIVGQLTVSPSLNLTDYIASEEPICNTSFHSHSWIANLAQGLSNYGENKVTVICFTSLISKNWEYEVEGVNYIYLKSESKIVNVFTFYYREFMKVKKILSIIKPDIVHAQGRQIEALYSIYSGLPTVITSHGEIKNELLSYRVNLRFIRSILLEFLVNRKMKYAIGVSPSCVCDLKRFLSPEKVFLIDNAIDSVFFENKDVKYEKYFFYVGSITERKGAFKVIQLLERFPDFSVKLAFQNRQSDYFSQIQEYIEKHGFQDRVEFLGNLSSKELAKHMRKCYCLCLPSDFESFGMSLAECQAVGKPVVATKVGGIPYVVDDQSTGFLFDLDKIGDFEDKVGMLVENRELTKQMGEKAEKVAHERWHPSSIAKSTMNVYWQVLRNNVK